MGYLYGASIQGIQGYIFETNTLKEIVGASDIVEWICSLEFLNKECRDNICITVNKEDVLRSAGGNIRIKFNDIVKLESFVKEFPKIVMQEAYGIVVSQAVVSYNKDKGDYLKIANQLEQKLKAARNRANYPLDAKFALMKQAPKTGKPAYERKVYEENNKIEYLDKSSWQKLGEDSSAWVEMLIDKIGQKSISNHFTKDMSEISNNNNKIAVIHADGNKMGLLLQQMQEEIKNKTTDEIQNIYKILSTQISKATNLAIKGAFEDVFTEDIKKSKEDAKYKIPFRPVIIGGDDLTVICSADKAIEFSKKYLELFEKYTKNKFKILVQKCALSMFENGLTACAGIAFCNEKFPFHYAVSLAEDLCGIAKRASNREASCLLFHNIQSSVYTNFDTYINNELKIKQDGTEISLQFGPYYLKDKKPTINALLEAYRLMSENIFSLSKLRKWLTELNNNKNYAQIFLERLYSIAKRDKNIDTNKINDALKELGDFELNKLISKNKTPIYDIIQLKSVLGANND